MMHTLFLIFLFVHIGSAIAGFGPTLAFSFLGAMGGREPMHANFALRVSHTIGDRLVTPLAIVVGVSGVGLIWTSGRNPFTQLWLLVAIVLYLATLLFALFVQRRVVMELIAATSGPPPVMPAGAGGPAGDARAPSGAPAGPPPGAPAGAPSGAPAGPPPGAPAGPPPHIAALVRRSQLGGMYMLTSLVIIVALMVFKPFGG
jgi:uncharacterized membrane protein